MQKGKNMLVERSLLLMKYDSKEEENRPRGPEVPSRMDIQVLLYWECIQMHLPCVSWVPCCAKRVQRPLPLRDQTCPGLQCPFGFWEANEIREPKSRSYLLSSYCSQKQETCLKQLQGLLFGYQQIAYSGCPFTDGDLIKECLLVASEEMCPDKKLIFQNLSLSRMTVKRREHDIADDLSKQLEKSCGHFVCYCGFGWEHRYQGYCSTVCFHSWCQWKLWGNTGTGRALLNARTNYWRKDKQGGQRHR